MKAALLELERFETDTEENQYLYDEITLNYAQWVRNNVQL